MTLIPPSITPVSPPLTHAEAPIPEPVRREQSARLSMVNRIRDRLRDHAELNTLVTGREFSDSQIERAIYEALDAYNSTPPRLGKAWVHNIDNPTLLADGAMGRLLRDAGLFYARNDISYSAGSIQVGFPQASTYVSMGSNMLAEFRAQVQEQKTALNVEQAMGAHYVHSDYQLVNYSSFSPSSSR